MGQKLGRIRGWKQNGKKTETKSGINNDMKWYEIFIILSLRFMKDEYTAPLPIYLIQIESPYPAKKLCCLNLVVLLGTESSKAFLSAFYQPFCLLSSNDLWFMESSSCSNSASNAKWRSSEMKPEITLAGCTIWTSEPLSHWAVHPNNAMR